MSHRVPVSAGTFAALLVMILLAPSLAAAQATEAAASDIPRTPDGRPDLQGVYNYATTVPLERPTDLAAKEALTEEEAAARLRARIRAQDAPPREGDPGTYNAFWRDLVDLEALGVVANATSLVVDPPDGRVPPLTPEAQRRRDANREADEARAKRASGEDPAIDWTDYVLNDRCILWAIAGPPMMPGPYNNNVQFFQTRDYFVIINEMIHDVRIIPLDGRPHMPSTVKEWQGDSRGRWEGDTLVVETRNFIDQTDLNTGRGNWRGSTGNMRLTERFTRVSPKTVMYEFTVDDPTVFTRPWTVRYPMTKIEDQLYEYACHEGNQSMGVMLSGSRAKEKAAAAAGSSSSR